MNKMIGENSIVLPFSTGKGIASDEFHNNMDDLLESIQASLKNINDKIQSIKSFIETFNPEEFADGIDTEEFERICRDNELNIQQISKTALQKDKLLEIQVRIKKDEEVILQYFSYVQNFETDIESFREEAEETPAEAIKKVLSPISEISNDSLSFSSVSTRSSRGSVKSENSTSIKNTLSIQEKKLQLAEKIEEMKKPLRQKLEEYDGISKELIRLKPTKNGKYKQNRQKLLKEGKSELEDSLGISPVWKSAAKGFAKGFVAGAAISAALACTAGVYVSAVASAAAIIFPPAIFIIPAFYTFVAVAAVAGGIVTGAIAAGVEAHQRSKYNHAIRSFIVEKSTDKFYLEPEPDIK